MAGFCSCIFILCHTFFYLRFHFLLFGVCINCTYDELLNCLFVLSHFSLIYEHGKKSRSCCFVSFPSLIYQAKFFRQGLEHVCSVRHAYSMLISTPALFYYFNTFSLPSNPFVDDFRIFFSAFINVFLCHSFPLCNGILIFFIHFRGVFFFIIHQIYWYGQFNSRSLLLIFLLFNCCARWLSGH